MKIRFRLAWAKGSFAAKHFKSEACHALFSEYLKRLSRFVPTDGSGMDLKKEEPGKPVRWFCHFSKEAKAFSSEELAQALEKMRRDGVREWEIVIGPADGFKKEDLAAWRPDLLWSFGPMTLTHEMASVIAAEQVYRSFTILAGQPYHSGH